MSSHSDGRPFWKLSATRLQHFLPIFHDNSRKDKKNTSQGYDLLHDHKFIKFAQKMTDLLMDFILHVKNEDSEKATNMRDTLIAAKEIIPPCLRIGET
eukprot:4577751-Ditylum_brightwellii.AAC.1